MSRSTEEKERKKERIRRKCCPKYKVPLSLYMRSTWYSSNIPKGWIGTLGLGVDVWRIQYNAKRYL